MAQLTRENVMTAFFALFSGLAVGVNGTPSASQPFVMASRRIQMPSDVLASNMPALFLTEHDETVDQTEMSNPGKITLEVALWIYITAGKDQAVAPITILNPLIDTVMNAFAPNRLTGVQTLGGLVVNAYPQGKVLKVDGALDGNGIAMIPAKILIPSF